MNDGNERARLWSIVLAGGEGERLKPFVQRWLGRHKPKQYCTFIGTRSMFQHTLDRADQIVEKCRTAVASGALWNTLVLAARAETLWEVGWQCFPEMMPLFERYGKAVGTSEEESVLESIYEVMPARNFSSHLLERLPQRVAVMELRDVLWSDWGKPERILETLQRIGSDRRFPRCTQPPFSGFCFEELAHGKSGNHGHSGAGRR